MSIRVSRVGVLGSAVFATVLMMGACKGTKSDATASGGSSGELGGAGNEEGGATSEVGGAGGTTATGGAGSTVGGASGASSGAPYVCKKGVPTGGKIAPGTNGTWGSPGPVSGGPFLYQDVDASKFAIDTATTPGSITLTSLSGTGIAPNGYAGYGIYFKDPEKCWDVSSFTGGIRMTLSGNLGDAKLVFQVQTNNNYPIDTTNSKGACTGTWSSGCGNNTTTSLTVTDTPTPIDIPWASITGGSPNATVETGELLGVQWQINCPTDATANCNPTLTIGTVELY